MPRGAVLSAAATCWSRAGGPLAGGSGRPVIAGWPPHGLEWKARTLAALNAPPVWTAPSSWISPLRSVEDGLIIASPEGRITFANRAAAAIWALLAARPGGAEPPASRCCDSADAERPLPAGGGPRPRGARSHLPRRAAATITCCAWRRSRRGENGDGPVLGIVASLSDVTRQHELQQTKNDVISLVSHEMRTPLTAIQGMTELLADYDVDPERRREMHLAINDEVKRLTRMITEYLDITRLESGATEVRLSPVRVESLRGAHPAAARSGGRAARHPPGPQLRPGICRRLLADPDLLSRAVENLVSNAIKYSPAGTEVTMSRRGRGRRRRVDRSGGPRLRNSRRRPGRASSRSSIGYRGCRTRACPAPAWAWPWSAKSPNCTAAPSPCGARWAPGSTFTLRIPREAAHEHRTELEYAILQPLAASRAACMRPSWRSHTCPNSLIS